MIHRPVLACWCCLLVAGCGQPADVTTDGPVGFSFSQSPGNSAVEVTNLPAGDLAALSSWASDSPQWPALLRVSMQDSAAVDRPSIVGTYRIMGRVLRFEPRFPFDPEIKYVVRLDPARLPKSGHAGAQHIVFEPTPQKTPPIAALAHVTDVFPSAELLPENQLKFYVHFSRPMSRGEAYSRVHLLNASGQPIDSAFLELGEELWNPEQTRFTLFIDPGRIKQGLKPREDLGPVLEAGKTYALVVDREWRDAAGRPLTAEYRKTFRTTAADEQSPDPAQWKIKPPAAGTNNPLVVMLPEPLDHALLLRMLSVADSQGKAVEGTVNTSDHESRWEFTPRQPWLAGAYRLVAATRLEDLAGNSIGRLFEVDVFDPVTEYVSGDTVSVPFEVSGGR